MSAEEQDSVSEWLEQLKVGDEAVVQEIWERYSARLVGLARRVLADVPRFSGVEEDVAQSAFKSFALRARDGRFPQLNDRDDLWKLLMTITLRKSLRDRRREGRGVAADPGILAAELVADAPSPAASALFTDELRRLFGKLDKPLLSVVALMKLDGYTNRQIARASDVSVATVERKLQVIRHLWRDEV